MTQSASDGWTASIDREEIYHVQESVGRSVPAERCSDGCINDAPVTVETKAQNEKLLYARMCDNQSAFVAVLGNVDFDRARLNVRPNQVVVNVLGAACRIEVGLVLLGSCGLAQAGINPEGFNEMPLRQIPEVDRINPPLASSVGSL
jgi:hypothetical protein